LKKPVKAHTSAGCPAAGKESAQQGRLPIKIEKGEKYYVASCPAFDVASQGKTVNKAKSNLGEALTAFFISCIERGVLDSVLKECGFKSAKKPSSARPRWTE